MVELNARKGLTAAYAGQEGVAIRRLATDLAAPPEVPCRVAPRAGRRAVLIHGQSPGLLLPDAEAVDVKPQ